MKKISPQRAYQIRHRAEGLCMLCPEPHCPESQNFCQYHRQRDNVKKRERARKKNGAKTRYKGAVSYQEKADEL